MILHSSPSRKLSSVGCWYIYHAIALGNKIAHYTWQYPHAINDTSNSIEKERKTENENENESLKK